MILTRRAIFALGVLFAAATLVFWAFAWFAPGLGLQYDDGAYLVAARALATGQGYVAANLPVPIAETGFPPLFPALLALWSRASLNPVWLKALPVACSALWFWLTWKLLRKMGASEGGATLIILLTAASPGVIAYGANLFGEPLFGALIAATFILLLDGRPALAGLAAGLAALCTIGGIPLAAACVTALIAGRRFRDAILFTVPAIVPIALWFGWALAHGAHDPGSGINSYSASNIIAALEPGDKIIVLLRNVEWLFESPFEALSGVRSPVAGIITAGALALCLIGRTRIVPDLFLLFYSVMLICAIRPPARYIAPVLPLVFWILWRVAGSLRWREAVAAIVLLAALVPLWFDFHYIPEVRRQGEFITAPLPSETWAGFMRLFEAVRVHTPDDAILAANFAPLVYFETGRKCVRGFDPSGFDLYYSPRAFIVPPDQLFLTLARNGVSFFALTPADIAPSGTPLHAAIGALERGGLLEYVPIEGLPRGYELLRVVPR